jgi:tetratricopeptide (TPR) repeat protein
MQQALLSASALKQCVLLAVFWGRFRVNMGNIYFEQGKYPAAIKMYRMALDALPAAAAGPRARLMTNIGLAFVQLGQYGDAAAAFENAMDTAADHQVSCGCCYWDTALHVMHSNLHAGIVCW